MNAKAAPKSEKSGSDMVREYFAAHPEASNKQIADATGVAPSQVSAVLKRIKGDTGESTGSGRKAKGGSLDFSAALKRISETITEFGDVKHIEAALEQARKIEKAGGVDGVTKMLESLKTLKGKI